MTNQHNDYDEPTLRWGSFFSFTFLFASLYLHGYKQFYISHHFMC